MEVLVSEAQIEEAQSSQSQQERPRLFGERAFYSTYFLLLAVSISVWFIAIRAPLWLDETGSYEGIKDGFAGILAQMGSLSFHPYPFILWLSSKMIGTSEIALRVPSILAMLGAVYLLYLAACELFERDIAIIAAIIFCLHPIVVFASIDVRPYAFTVLATNAAILTLLRLRYSNSRWLAAQFGFSALCIVWLHMLSGVILPALALCFIAVRFRDLKIVLRKYGVVFAVFLLALLMVLIGKISMYHDAGSHIFEQAPTLEDLTHTFKQGHLLLIFAITALIGFVKTRFDLRIYFQSWHVLFCVSLALIPLLILYGVSVATPIHCFVPRHRIVAIPGIALCWALALTPFRSRGIRLLFCVVLVAVTAHQYFGDPLAKRHEYTWKYALEAAEKNASVDSASVLICNDFPESNYLAMPMDFAPLSYYKLSVPVVDLPRALNGEAIRVGSNFLREATQKHERFLALAYLPSYKTLDWIEQNAAEAYSVRTIGVFDDIKVLEFTPRTQLNASR